jgi:peptidoglycan-N-acetylglucosamine deacetylase
MDRSFTSIPFDVFYLSLVARVSAYECANRGVICIMFYFVKTPWLLKKIYPNCIWTIPTDQKLLFLTFDDGPHPVATPIVLEELQKYHAQATFFCIGKNVVEQPDLYRRILDEGHRVGNHSHNHLNGWKTPDKQYLQNIRQAAKYIDSDLYRPPYGRMSRFQMANLRSSFNMRIIMWDVLSGDFDPAVSPEKCALHVKAHATAGSIIIFHDSAKALDRLKIALPQVLEHFTRDGFLFKAIA